MPSILLVEDDPFIAEIYKKKFETSGFDVVNAVTGKEVLKEALAKKFDLVLLDLVLPEMSGMDVLRELRRNPAYDKKLKVVVFSNLSSSEDREECMQLGASGFISKTEFSPTEVVVEVNRLLHQFGEQDKNHARREHPVEQTELGKRILLIDDEAMFVEMFGKRLRDEGYNVVTESDGVTGLDTAAREHFDMIISDVLMPGLEGTDLVKRLKDIEGKESVPVFFFSASLENGTLKELAASGLVNKAFLKTEITPSELVTAVNDFFKKQT